MMITFIAALALVCALSSGDDGLNFRALSFGRTRADYIQFQPGDMSPFSTSFTICSWMKRLHDESSPIVLHYYPWELVIGDNGYWNYANKHLDLSGKFPEANQWFHHCLSWVAGGTQRVYVNGVQLGSTSAVAGRLAMGGTITLGNQVQDSKSTSFIFGGQLHKLNWYSEELTSSQIREMFEAGLCSTVEKKYSSREIKWELILTKKRHGNVTEFLPTECATHEEDCKTKLEETEVKLATIEHKLQEVTATLNDTLSETQTKAKESETKLQETQAALEESETKHQGTKSELTESRHQHQGTKTELTELETKLQETQAALEKSESQHQGTKTELCKKLSKKLSKKLKQKENKLIKTDQELQEIAKTLNDTKIELLGTQVDLEELKMELQETDAKLNSAKQELQENSSSTVNGPTAVGL